MTTDPTTETPPTVPAQTRHGTSLAGLGTYGPGMHTYVLDEIELGGRAAAYLDSERWRAQAATQ